MTRRWHLLFGCGSLALITACAAGPPTASTPLLRNRITLEGEAMDALKAAIDYKPNAVVRVEAVEALESGGLEEALPWIRSALIDEHPAVRFAACIAAGMARDHPAQTLLGKRIDDDDPSVRASALFALHRLGDTTGTGHMPPFLLTHDDPAVRRNAAFVIGLLGEVGAVRILAKAMRDSDDGVRQHALEAMARLGNRDAKRELTFMANSGLGSEEVFALNALGQTGDPRYEDTFRYKLETAVHLETRLAAARGLGLLGFDEGFEVALSALTFERPTSNDPNDPPREQVLRIRQLAAAALGAIGRSEALPSLREMLHHKSDPRVQVSAARAILEILRANRARDLPFGPAD